MKGERDGSVLPVALFTRWDVGNACLLTGGPLGFDGAKAELEFVFSVPPGQMKKRGTVILLDADGNRHKGDWAMHTDLDRPGAQRIVKRFDQYQASLDAMEKMGDDHSVVTRPAELFHELKDMLRLSRFREQL